MQKLCIILRIIWISSTDLPIRQRRPKLKITQVAGLPELQALLV